MNWAVVAILLFVTFQRLAELVIDRINTQRLVAQGAIEHSRGHFPLIVALHAAWLLTLWVLAPTRGIDPFWLALFVLLTLARFWVLATLGPRWTTRIIVIPDAPLVKEGPYRFVNHPNYWVVIGEIAVLPLVFGLPLVAMVFSILNAAILWVRIKAENRALGR